ncbi:DUF192 domain-containing protein [Chloroflexota bacterium]
MEKNKGRVQVVNRKTGQTLIESAKWCQSRFCRLIGFQFRRRLKPGEALILAHDKDTIGGSSIHMFFVFTSLAVVWVNSQGRATHIQLARPWRPHYASPTPACYVLETSPDFIERISVGDELDFIPR